MDGHGPEPLMHSNRYNKTCVNMMIVNVQRKKKQESLEKRLELAVNDRESQFPHTRLPAPWGLSTAIHVIHSSHNTLRRRVNMGR